MSDEDDRLGLAREHAPGRRYVVCERGGRVLHDADCVAVFLEELVDLLPARSVHEAAVYQDNRYGHFSCAGHLSPPGSGAPRLPEGQATVLNESVTAGTFEPFLNRVSCAARCEG